MDDYLENSFINLPNELFLRICDYLSAKQVICVLGLVCKQFNERIKHDLTWKHRLFQRFPKSYPPVPLEDLNWMRACVEREKKYEILNNLQASTKQFSLNAHAFGHVDCLKLFKNGRFCASGSRDGSIAVWDLDKFKNHETFSNCDVTNLNKNGLFAKYLDNAHKGWVWTIDIFDHKWSSGSWDKTIKILDLNEDLKEIQTLRLKSAVICHCLQENQLVAGSFDKKVYLYDLRNNQAEQTHVLTHHSGAVVNLALKENTLITSSEDKHVCISDLRMMNNPFKRLEFEFVPLSLCFKYNQLWIGTRQIQLYDANHNEFNHVETLNFGHEMSITGLCYTLGALVTCSKDKTLKFSEPSLKASCFRTIKFDRQLSDLDYSNDILAVANELSIEFFIPR